MVAVGDGGVVWWYEWRGVARVVRRTDVGVWDRSMVSRDGRRG